ncbi:hypothetical protein PG994_005995 [Apiospora phragmitis]|uniref:Clr5 domain-containing protein n=1 Tax=Apiospora phragmitis TaxID=2905665 RepID=A0ABR1VHA8_9PEZI
MTKDWDNYKETILALYEHQTLAQVMEVMERDYNFVASTRAYRQKLDKWGKRKYKKRKGRSDNSPEASDGDSADEGAGSSIPASSPEVSRRKGDAHAYQQRAQSTSTGYGANASTFQPGDANYSLNYPGTNISSRLIQAPLDQNAAVYGYDGMSYPTDNTAAAPFQYMDASGGGFPMDNQMDYTTYPDGSWDQA